MVSETLVENACRQLQCTQADLARLLNTRPQRLWEWRTMRRRMPSTIVEQLVELATQGLSDKVVGLKAETIGHYTIEWTQHRQRTKRRQERLA